MEDGGIWPGPEGNQRYTSFAKVDLLCNKSVSSPAAVCRIAVDNIFFGAVVVIKEGYWPSRCQITYGLRYVVCVWTSQEIEKGSIDAECGLGDCLSFNLNLYGDFFFLWSEGGVVPSSSLLDLCSVWQQGAMPIPQWKMQLGVLQICVFKRGQGQRASGTVKRRFWSQRLSL